MQAVILAGGKGTRLKPYTAVFPKPLMPIGDYPILEVVVRQLKKFGFDTIKLTLGHQAELFRLFFGDGSKWDLDIKYTIEDQPLGTAGPLRLIDHLDDNFLMMNGDILTDLDFSELMTFHKAHGNPATIVTHQREVKINYGSLHFDESGVLQDYQEKPTLHYNVSMGIYALSKSVLNLIPDGRAFNFPDLMLALIKRGEKVICKPHHGYWLDIGLPDDYAQAIDDFDRMKEELL
jgi:NDP-mannose synthase